MIVPRPLFWKALGVLALLIGAMVAAKSLSDWVGERGRLEAIEGMGQVVIRQVDTLHARNVRDFEDAREEYEAARDTADTVEELTEALVEADHAIQSCTLVIASCDARVAARDSLIKALMRPKKQPLVRPFAEAMYDATNKQWMGRVGADALSLPGDFSLRVEGEVARKSALRVGLRKEF
jgi:hypothetical protein